MHKNVVKIGTRRLPQSNRNKYSANPIQSSYPVISADLLYGVMLNRAQRILREFEEELEG